MEEIRLLGKEDIDVRVAQTLAGNNKVRVSLLLYKNARVDMKIMDEHVVVDGKVVEFDNDFVDHSLISFEGWKAKHRAYAKREAQSHLSGERSTGAKTAKKEAYYKLPPYFRAFAYFCIRYFLKLGFLDGLPGLRWHFWHGLWYRCLVDREISKLKACK